MHVAALNNDPFEPLRSDVIYLPDMDFVEAPSEGHLRLAPGKPAVSCGSVTIPFGPPRPRTMQSVAFLASRGVAQ